MRALLALPLLALLLLLACSSTSSTTTPTVTPRPPPRHPASCAWYTATSDPAGVVTVTATGPACRDRSLIDWLTSDTDRPWTTTALVPGALGTLIAGFTRNGSTCQVWFTGPAIVEVSPNAPTPSPSAPPAAKLAGELANALMASGWQPNPNN